MPQNLAEIVSRRLQRRQSATRDMIQNGFRHMNKHLSVLALLVTTLPIAAQTGILVAKSRIPISIAGDYPGGVAFPTSCDEQGHFYVKLIKQGPGMMGPIFRLSSKGVAEAEFDTSGEVINRYAVRPDGGIIMLHVSGSSKVIDNFAPDGTRGSSVQLEHPPTPFFPSQLAVFHSGEMLVAGLQYSPDYKASTAIYDPMGRLVKQFALDGDAEIEHAIEVGGAKDNPAWQQHIGAIDTSVATTGDDGLVYLMRATSPAVVYAISAAGDVVRKIVVSAPAGTGKPYFGIRVVKNRLAGQFRRDCDSTAGSGSCRSSSYAVVDATTGKKLAAYEADKDVAAPIACYAPDPDRFFTFQQQSKTVFDIVQAEAK